MVLRIERLFDRKVYSTRQIREHQRRRKIMRRNATDLAVVAVLAVSFFLGGCNDTGGDFLVGPEPRESILDDGDAGQDLDSGNTQDPSDSEGNGKVEVDERGIPL
jgi:hypothetical protein